MMRAAGLIRIWIVHFEKINIPLDFLNCRQNERIACK